MTLNEVAPPTKKHERMVKHIKKSYGKKGGLSGKEKSIAYATAWKNYNKTKNESVENGKVDLTLKTDVNNVLKQDNKEYDRGLLAQVNKDGSYDVAYWYDKYKAYPVEVEIDGKTCAKDAKNIHIKFHPELEKESFEYEKLKKKIGSKEKHMKPAITETDYSKLKGWEKSILQQGLKVKSGLAKDQEMARLVKMYPGFKVEEVALEGVARFDKLVKTIKNTPDLSKEKEAKLLKVAGKVRGIPEEVSRKRKPSAIRKKKKLEKLLIDKEVSKIQKEEMTYQEAIDAGWEMTGEGIWWPPQDTEIISERMSFKSFRSVLDKKKKKEEKKPEKAQDAGAKARRAMKRREHAKYVSGSEDNVPDDLRDHYEVSKGKKIAKRKYVPPYVQDWEKIGPGGRNTAPDIGGNKPMKA